MKKIIITIFIFSIIFFQASGQKNMRRKVFTSDIDHFWNAYDSCQKTTDSLKQLHYIQTLYIDKGTPGLRAFMEARDYTPEIWVRLIRKYPRFWKSIRPNTLTINSTSKQIEQSIQKLKKLYPQLKEAKMYFTIGGLNSGGTTVDNMVLVGAEIATANANTDVSEFSDKWLAGVFKSQQSGNIVPLNIHEYIHTQQKGESQDLLAESIKEGACDFIMELVMAKPLQNHYIVYGREHEAELKELFIPDMFSTNSSNWLYNGANAKSVADLGYFMGYSICKSYYNNATDKKKAVRDIIELNYSDTAAIENFLKRSKYYSHSINRPYVLRLEPFSNGDTLVDASIKEIKVVFSTPMMTSGYSINDGERGKDFSPITGIGGFSDDGTSFKIKVELQSNHEYEFTITNKTFRSAEGYSLRPYNVKFKTK
jgi:hypothetical protein